VPFLVLFVASGLALFGRRRWAPTLAVVILELLLAIVWTTCAVTLTLRKWFSFSQLPALGWLVAALVCFGALGLLTQRRWMFKAAALALPVFAIAVWAIGLVLLMLSEPGGRRSIGVVPPEPALPVAAMAAMAVLINSAFVV
jgi:hypothetical protein